MRILLGKTSCSGQIHDLKICLNTRILSRQASGQVKKISSTLSKMKTLEYNIIKKTDKL